MSLTLAAADTITGVAGSATSITYTIFGDEISAGADTFKVLAQGQLPASVGTLYTVPGATSAIVKAIHLVNGTGGSVTARLNVKGTAAANAILPAITILAGGFAIFGDDGWKVYNDQGQLLSVGATGTAGSTGAPGADGADGVGIPVGGTTAQRLAKIDATDYNTEWVTAADAISEITTIPTAEMDDTLVLAPDGAGGVEFRAEAGGGGGGLYEDAFTSLSGWTQLGTLDVSNVSDVSGYWHGKRACSSEIDGIYQAVPSLPFTVTVKVAAYDLPGTTHPSLGIMLLDATPTAIREFSFCFASGTTWGVELRRYTNRTTFATSVDVTITPTASWIYLRLLVTSSTSVTFSYSFNGLIWITPATLTAIDPTLTPAYVGLLLSDPVSASTPEVYFRSPVIT